jgi:NAD(P)H-dependent flavin oxidoreductase YrpB (nitropropane dioxygenase family)
MTEESGGHAQYKARLLEAQDTVLTELFGLGWPAPHRVVRNAATARWLGDDPRGPGWLRRVQTTTAPFLRRLPARTQERLASGQKASRPLFGPVAATAGGPENLIDAGPLYAGESIARVNDIRPAGILVREMVEGSSGT